MRAELQATFAIWFDRLTRSRPDWGGLTQPVEGTSNVLAFSPQDYLGVTEATRRFFPGWHALNASDLLLERDRRALIEALVATAPEALVFSGFTHGYREILEGFRARRPETPVHVLWHASPLQLVLREERRHYDSILELARAGVVTRIGFFKTGEAAAHSRLGVEAADVFNLPPPGLPTSTRLAVDAAERRRQETNRVDIFSAGPSWRKNPYAMIAAAGRLGSVLLSGVLDAEARRYATDLGIELEEVRDGRFDRAELERVAARQDVNLYVGLSECSPLFPLESLHWGVPCLIGATSHLFEASPVSVEAGGGDARRIADSAALLEDRLVVARADDPASIARALGSVLEESDSIHAAYRDWVSAYRAAAWASMEALVGLPLERGVEE